ncbi:Mss4-like protein [Daldinia eschscholtzii]|nr:Mss4-like protein [Daldinia eschscholtzii]
MSQSGEVSISCLCGAVKQTVVLRSTESGSGPLGVDLCHCYDCRHTSGLLCVSYAPIKEPLSLGSLVAYPDKSTQPSITASRRYFCGTCGCHVFRCSADSDDPTRGSWEVATGIIIGPIGTDKVDDEKDEPLLRYSWHVNIDSTKDGGLSPFIKLAEETFPSTNSQIDHGEDKDSNATLEAHCHCKTVRFFITRPDASSRLPRSGFPDLTVPFATSPQDVITNPHDEKWWLRPQSKDNPNLTRYLAGTCACRSCRLASGFEIQTWAFVPRNAVPLDFPTLQQTYSPLRGYESSPGVVREFCARCGASVFWHDVFRPDLVDVSVGLLAAEEEDGARAERWLDWWCGRVSFQEEAENGRDRYNHYA